VFSIWDDIPLHQTPAPLGRPVTSDPAAYERYYFNCFDQAGEWMVGLVVNIHPNKALVDAVFSVSHGGVQESLYATDCLRGDRSDISCGPVRLTFVEPMRELRIRVSHNELEADITYLATTPAIAEDRVTRERFDVVVQDRSRYAQFGTVRGALTSPAGSVSLNEQTWRAGRDHSWGIWDAPKQHAQQRQSTDLSFIWLVGAFEDWGFVAVTHAQGDGQRYGEYAGVVPTLSAGSPLAGDGVRQRRMDEVHFEPTYADVGWHMRSCKIDLVDADATHRMRLESVHEIFSHSIGYNHPDWRPGTLFSELPSVVRQSWNVSKTDLTERQNHRAFQAVRLTRADGSVGYGLMDQCVSEATAAGVVPNLKALPR
jgi:hypothetical protein